MNMNTHTASIPVSSSMDAFLSWMQPTARLLLCLLPWCLVLGAAASEIVLSTIAGLFVIYTLLAKDQSWLKSSWVKVAIGIWAYLVMTNFMMNGFAIGIKHSLPWGRFILFAAALEFWVLSDPKWRKRFWLSLSGAICFTVMCGVYEYLSGMGVTGKARVQSDRLFGPFRRPKIGIFLVKISFPVLLMAMTYLAQNRRTLSKLMAVCLWGGFVGIVFLSGERMALLLLGLGSLLAFLFMSQFRKFFFLTNVFMGALLGALLFILPAQKERFVDSSLREFNKPLESPYQVLMGSALRVTKDFPVFGVGVRQFRDVCPNPRYGENNGHYGRCSTHPHNFYIEWLVEAGVVGLLGFLILIGTWGSGVIRSFPGFTRDALSVGLVISIALQLWPIGSSGSFFNNWNSCLFWMMLGLMNFYLKLDKNRA